MLFKDLEEVKKEPLVPRDQQLGHHYKRSILHFIKFRQKFDLAWLSPPVTCMRISTAFCFTAFLFANIHSNADDYDVG